MLRLQYPYYGLSFWLAFLYKLQPRNFVEILLQLLNLEPFFHSFHAILNNKKKFARIFYLFGYSFFNPDSLIAFQFPGNEIMALILSFLVYFWHMFIAVASFQLYYTYMLRGTSRTTLIWKNSSSQIERG